MTKFSVLLLVPTLLFLTVSDSTVSTRLSQAAADTAGAPAVAARGRGNPRIFLSDGRDLSEGADGAGVLDGQEAGIPLTLSCADFDNDGVPDLAAGYRRGNAGAVVLRRGNEDAIHPNTAAAVRRRETGEFLESPFFASLMKLETAEPPDWLAAGDFDGDGNADLVFASRGSAALHVLPGDGAGGFRPPLQRDLPGTITTMAGGTLDPGSGGLGIAVAILGGRGASLLLFDSGSSGSFEAVALPGPATGLAIARLGDGPRPDVVAVAGSELVVAHREAGAGRAAGKARVERRSLPFWAAAVTAGHFGTGFREGLAFLAEDGRSWVLQPGEVPAPEKAEEAAPVRAASRREAMAASPAPHLQSGSPAPWPAAALRVADLKDWALTETAGDPAQGGVSIRAARLSGSEADDLVVLDGRGRRIDVISPPPPEEASDRGGARSLSARRFSSSAALEVSGEPVAVLPMRLNEDGVSDLVVLRSGSITPAVVLSAPALSLTVNSNGDTGDASPGNGICADSNGNCTLRAAIQEANASAGADTINFAISGAGVHTITTGSSLPTITGTVTIDGTTQSGYAGLPLIELKGATGQIGLTIRVSDCVVRGLAVNGYEASGQTGGVGIYVLSSGPLVKNALLEANFIGTDPTGTQSKPNHLGIDFENTSLHTVGGTTAAARNLISGNSLVGIQVIGPAASGNTFLGNYVGTTANGSAALPNAFAGFNLFANNTVVGGPAAGAGNVISGNGGGGLFTSQFCAPSCFGSGTVVTSNKIGTNPAGTAAVGNTAGVLTSSPGSPNTTIANNLISGNPNGGIQIDESLAGVTTITGNFIGTDVTGTLALGNGNNGGILIHTTVATAQINVGGATGTTAGGSCTGSCNLISANSPFGVYAFGSGPVSIVYNFIGTDVTGTQALGNDSAGVVLAAGGKTVGSSAASGNLISGNGDEFSGGAGVLSQSTGNPGNTIKGNLIGTTTTGNAALGNLGDGVILGAFDTLGGSAAADRNVISGNVDNGVVIAGASSVSSKVQGNFIGTKKNGTAALANGAEGVLITNSASTNTVGGVNAGEGNVIAFNAFNGVWVESGTGNAVEGNSIFSNGALGIDLGAFGVDFNDLGDTDTGANNLQNYPNLASAVSAGGSTTITGSLNSKANTAYRLEFFSSPAADPTAHGEGQTFLGSKDVTTGNDGNISFTAIFAGALAPGTAVTATATSPSGDTSEFSCGAGLCQADVSIVKTDTPDPAEAGKELTYTLTVSNAGPSEASGVQVTDPLPSTVNFVSADASQGTCLQANKTVTCDLGSIGNGAQATVTIVVVPTKIGKISNTATVTRTEPDPVSSNDSSKADTQVVPTKIVVNTTGDESDLDTSDDICDVDAQTDGSQCTLRAAIQMSNAKADLQAIVFDIPGGANHTISPGSPLPAITDPVLLDATTQPGFSGLPVIELNGAAAGGNGLTLAAGDSTIKGLAINRFSGHGLLIQTKGNNVIQGNIIGTNAASAAGLGNGGDGISIDGQSGNTIGSLAPGGNAPEGSRPLAPSSFVLGLSNVIAGNSGRGISILSSLGIADLNKILTNAIGTDFAGKSGVGNLLEGVFLQSAIRTTIQNTVVASSGKCGIQAELKLAAAQQQLQQLNALMLDMNNSISGAFKSFNSALPREARPQSTEAIQSLFGGFASIFSGPTVPLGNLLGGLCMEEILSSLPNPATTVKILGSLFAANQGPGISATKTNAVQMLGSMVGTDETGAAGLGNTDGVKLVGSLNSLLGDPNFASSFLNVVAGNLGRGIAIQSQAGLISDLNKIFGTYVGTDFNGKAGLGNGQDGVQLTSALRTIVQGSVLAANGKCGMSADLKLAEAQQQLQQVNGKLVEMINTVSGAHKKILSLIGQRARPASEKIAVTSLFGGINDVFASGTSPLGNLLGGACLEEILTQLPNTSTVLVNLFGSLLAANSGPGVSATNVMGLQMQGSIVGTDENGGSGLGNIDGMLLKGLKNSVLGDPNFVANALNVVAGNSGRGVVIQSLSGLLSDVNKIFGTYVGTDLNGKTGLGNGQDGVQLMSALRTTVQGSVLAGNGKCGMSADLKLAEAQQQLQQSNVKVVEMFNTISGSHKKILSLLGQRARPASVDIGGGLFGGLTSVFGGTTTQIGNALGGFCLEEILNSLANPQPTIDILGSMFAGNKGPGITATNVSVMKLAGSLIGTDEASAAGLGNTDGVFLKGVSKSVFGDTGLSPNLVNVVAGNSGRGFLVQSVSGLLSDLNKIVATYVGTDLNGKAGLGNGGDGIQLLSAIRTTIDATVMSGNGGCGVEANLTLPEAQAQMQQLTDQTLTIQRSIHGLFKQFVGNLGGGRSPGVMTRTDARDIRIVGPSGFGGGLFGSTSKLLGNLGFGACLDQILKVGLGGNGLGNLFSGNQAGGILASLATVFKAEGNWIGTDENGAALANQAAGMLLKGVNTGSIGGVAAGLGNVIAGNLGAGIDMQAFQGQFTHLITILNNLIGVTRGNATTVLKNLQGIRIENSPNNVVGSAGSGNIIAGNTSDGIVITGPSSTGNVVAGNFIGTDETSVALGNGGNGVLITAAAGNSLVGTSDVIAFNSAAGVEVDATAGCCNAVDPNTIFGNGGLGIDLGSPGPTPNDPADADSGPNNLQNFPDFVSARINGSGELVIGYRVDSAPANSNYGANGLLVEFFRADPGGEGRTFLGNDFYTAADYANGLPGARQVNFGDAAARGVSLGDTIVASATDASGNSSEFTSSGLGPGGAFTICSGSSSETIAATASVCANRKGILASIPSSGPGSTYNWTIGNGTITAGAGTNTIVFTSGASGSVSLSVTASSGSGCGVQSGNLNIPITACSADPQGLAVDPTPDGAFSNGNGILEPGETVRVRPSWKNLGGTPLALSGTASGLTGPPGAAYTPNDSTANYGSIAAGATADCSATGDCYEFSVSNPATRPVTHWDARFNESLSDGDPATVRLLHVGDSFQDVPRNHVFYPFIERILHNGVTTGCTPSTYCPDAPVFRLQMAVFVARTQAGGDANVPVSGTAHGQPYNCVSGGTSLFSDVLPSNAFCRHVHYIYSTNVTTGCEPGKYCPDPDLTRAQMALFISRAIAGSDAAVPQTYGPDPVTGRSYSCNPASPNLHFTDITASDIFCRATHFLWARDVISGFPDGSYGPSAAVTRGAMAKFLANGFKLGLYGP